MQDLRKAWFYLKKAACFGDQQAISLIPLGIEKAFNIQNEISTDSAQEGESGSVSNSYITEPPNELISSKKETLDGVSIDPKPIEFKEEVEPSTINKITEPTMPIISFWQMFKRCFSFGSVKK